MTSPDQFLKLLDKYTKGELTKEEHDVLMTCIRSEVYDALLLDHIEKRLNTDTGNTEGLPTYRSDEIIRRIVSAEKEASLLIPFKPNKVKWMRWVAAAVLAGLIAVSAYLLSPAEDKQEVIATAKIPASGISSTSGEYIERANESKDPQTVELNDGSIIILKPGSRLKYPKRFSENKREVHLQGAAFFQIAKNRKRPFFVYTRDVVTRVIGTSFNVKTDQEKGLVEVAVRTGKVEVYEKHRKVSDESKRKNGVILLPNHKVVYHEIERRFIASLVDEPLPVKAEDFEELEQSSEFDEIALSDILSSLEATYGIEILVEDENIYKCLFTGDISKQNLYTKLEIICKTLNASYDIIGTKIMIRGKGCE